jgi:hypothetical protein
MLPRYLFYAVLVTSMLVTFLVMSSILTDERLHDDLVMGSVPTALFWFETIKIWRRSRIDAF